MTTKGLDEILKYAIDLCADYKLSVLKYEEQLAINPSEAVEKTKQYIKRISQYKEDCYGL